MTESKEIALVLTGTLPEISGNFDACKAFYLSELARYDAVVTADSLPEDKKNVTKLRAEIKRLDRIRIDEATRLKAPISKMESNVKELTGLIEKTVEKINSQVKKFEDETRDLCRSLMKIHLTRRYEELEVRAEFRSGESMIESLIGISKVTSKGALAKDAKENIEGLAAKGRMDQDRVDGRVASIGAECLKAGLSEAMPKEYFERYLAEPDAVWFSAMAKIIKFEADRRAKEKADQEAREAKKITEALAAQQAEANRKAKEKADADAKAEREAREKKEKEEREKLEREKKPTEPPIISPAAVTPPAVEKTQPRARAEEKPPLCATKDELIIEAVFKFRVNHGTSPQTVCDYVRKEIIKAGLFDLVSVTKKS